MRLQEMIDELKAQIDQGADPMSSVIVRNSPPIDDELPWSWLADGSVDSVERVDGRIVVSTDMQHGR